MRSLCVPILIFLPLLSSSQHLLTTTKYGVKYEVFVQTFKSNRLKTVNNENIYYEDLTSVIFIDYDPTRDYPLVKALQASNVIFSVSTLKEMEPILNSKYLSDSAKIVAIHFQNNQEKFYKQRQAGRTFVISGVILIGLSFSLGNPVFAGAGAVAILVGGIKIMDSYKFVKRTSQKAKPG